MTMRERHRMVILSCLSILLVETNSQRFEIKRGNGEDYISKTGFPVPLVQRDKVKCDFPWDDKLWCKCYNNKETIFSDNKMLRCDSPSNVLIKGSYTQKLHGYRSYGTCSPSARIGITALVLDIKSSCSTSVYPNTPTHTSAGIRKIELWNVQINTSLGLWQNVTENLIAVHKFIDMSNGKLKFSGRFGDKEWEGQLLKISFINNKERCVHIKIPGNITYPFDTKKLFPAVATTPTPPTKTTTTTTRSSATYTEVSSTKTMTTILAKTTTARIPTTANPTTKPLPPPSPKTINTTTTITLQPKTSTRTSSSSPSKKTISPGEAQTTTTSPPLSGGNTNDDEDEEENSNKILYIALGVATCVVLLLLVIIIIMCNKRSNAKGGEQSPSMGDTVEDGGLNNPIYLQTIHSSHPHHHHHHQQQSNQNNYSTVGDIPKKGRPRDPSVLSTTSSTTSSTCNLLNNRSSANSADQTYAVVDEPNSSSVVDNVYMYADTAFEGRRSQSASGNTNQTGLNPITENYEDSVFQAEEEYQELEGPGEQPEYREVHLEMDVAGRSPQATETYTSLAKNQTNQHENYAELTNQNRDSSHNNNSKTQGQEQLGAYAALRQPAQQETYESLTNSKNKTKVVADGKDYNKKQQKSSQETYTTLERDQSYQAETYEQLLNNNVGQCDQGTYSVLDCPAQETYEELTNTGNGMLNPNYESGDAIYHMLTPK